MSLASIVRGRISPELDPRLAPHFYGEFDQDPIMIYDVGAAGGVYSPYSQGPQKWAPVTGFEPHPESYTRLNDAEHSPYVSLHNYAITNYNGKFPFNAGIGKARGKSSLLPIDILGLSSKPETVSGLSLDSVEAVLGLQPANFLKLDTEGTEKDILQGGPLMLSNATLGVRTEIAFWRPNKSAAAFWEIDKFLTELGFTLFDIQLNRSDIRSIGGRKDKVRSGDALYLKKFDCDTHENPRIQLLKLLSLCVAWRYLNYALELADFGRRKNYIDQNEFELMATPWLNTVDLSDHLPNFYGRRSLARLFDILSYMFNPTIKKSVPFPFNGLGNHWIAHRIGRQPSEVNLYCPLLEQGSKHRQKHIPLKSSSADFQPAQENKRVT